MAFITGWSRSTGASRATRSASSGTREPDSPAIAERAASRRVASMSTIDVNCGIWADSAMWRAIERRRADMRSRRPSTGSEAASRSATVIEPPGPVPATVARSIPRSRASLRTLGSAFTESVPAGADGLAWSARTAGGGAAAPALATAGAGPGCVGASVGAGPGCVGASVGAGDGWGSRSGGSSPGSPTTKRASPTATTSPGSPPSASTVPLRGWRGTPPPARGRARRTTRASRCGTRSCPGWCPPEGAPRSARSCGPGSASGCGPHGR